MTHALERRPDETRALTRLTFEELASAAGGIGDVHRAVADRIFRLTGPAATPARAAHDTISGAIYEGLKTGVSLTALGADAVLGKREPQGDGRGLSSHPRGALAIAILDGLIGDKL